MKNTIKIDSCKEEKNKHTHTYQQVASAKPAVAALEHVGQHFLFVGLRVGVALEFPHRVALYELAQHLAGLVG
jgi:hypothetical protein